MTKSRSLREFQRRSVNSRLRTHSERTFTTAIPKRSASVGHQCRVHDLQQRVNTLRETHLSVSRPVSRDRRLLSSGHVTSNSRLSSSGHFASRGRYGSEGISDRFNYSMSSSTCYSIRSARSNRSNSMMSSVFDPDLDAVQEVDSSAGTSDASPGGSIHHDFSALPSS